MIAGGAENGCETIWSFYSSMQKTKGNDPIRLSQ